MGRADLSRHRGAHPSESRQTTFPSSIHSKLHHLSLCDDPQLSEAASAILNASTQRQQQTGIKALCATLPTSKDNPLVGAVLGAIMTLPNATSGIVSTALRGCLRTCTPELVQTQIESMYDRLGNVHDFPTAVADMRLTAALLSEHDARDFILANHTRLERVISHICKLVDVYLRSSTGDVSEMYDVRLLPDACDSAMKATQDMLNCLHRRGEHRYDVECIASSCRNVLGMEFVPRSCALACGVAFVTGSVLCSCAGTTKEVVDVTTDILSRVKEFPPFSRLALLRALMEAPAARPALSEILFPSNDESKSVFDSLASIVTANADVHLRFLAMDTLISCIRRAKPLPRRCRDVVLALIYERWQEPFPGVASQIREAMQALVATDRGEEDTAFWTSLAERLAEGDWKAKGMHAPLGVLVRRIGALQFLAVKANCQQLALEAVAADYRLVKHAVDWLITFWKKLREQVTFTEFFRVTGGMLVDALVDSQNRTLRERVAEHALPEYFRAVKKCDVFECTNGLLSYLAGMKSSSQEARARGTVCILSVARKNGVFAASFTDSEIYGLLKSALDCAEEDVRSSALDLIVTSRVPTEPVLQEELDLVLGYLSSALTPGGSLAYRSRFRHSMRRLYERLAACRHAAKDGSGGWWMRVRKERFGGKRTLEFEEMRTSLLERIARFETTVLSLLQASCYPGAAVSRTTSALEVMELHFKNLGCNDVEIANESFLASIFVCLTDDWERVRRAALHVLSTLPVLEPAVDYRTEVVELQNFGVSLLFSPRQKDVDSGVSLLRAIVRRYVLCEQGNLPEILMPILHKTFRSKTALSGSIEHLSDLRTLQDGWPYPNAVLRGLEYIRSILRLIQDILDQAESDFSEACSRGLFHGPFLLFRCVVKDIPWKTLPRGGPKTVLMSTMDDIVDLACKSTKIAMNGVSFKAFEEYMTEPDNPEEENYVTDDEDILLKEKRQLESTSCFQSIKEICIALGILSHEVPVGVSTDAAHHPLYLLEEKHISQIGNLFLYIFQNTRHWGVLDGASEGFQLLCESLLRCSSGSLRSLPRNWSCETVRLALSEGLYVLRRSAGVPAVINAIVNAEGNCNRRSYESPLLHETCSTLLEHLEDSAMFTDEQRLEKQRSKQEESVSHSLNLLRSLFLNSNVATTILRHLERAAICCLKAFGSASWLIRNSAMMLFSAIVRRGIGTCVEKQAEIATSSFASVGGTSATLEGQRRLRGTTAFQFFSRHPKLHPFLLTTLHDSTKRLESGALEDHAALYPALYLLSCLSPAAAEDPSTAISMKPFRPILRRCSHCRSDYVRRVAAAAYVPILEDASHVARAVREILSEVPTEPDTAISIIEEVFEQSCENGARRGGVCSVLERTVRLSQNKLHGDLLTVSRILNRTRGVMSREDRYETVGVLDELLPTRIWIAKKGQKNPCSYTRAAMVSVVSEGHVLAQDVRSKRPSDAKSSRRADALLKLSADLGSHLVEFSDHECGFGAPVGMACLLRRTGELLQKQSILVGQPREAAFIESLQIHLSQAKSASRDTILCGVEGCVTVMSKHFQMMESCDVPDHEAVLRALDDVWRCAGEIMQKKDDHEVIVGVLRLQIEILNAVKKCSGTDARVICSFTNAYLMRITKWARLHSCVDIREYALVLLGILVSDATCSEPVWIDWMSAAAEASRAQETTTRMASCTTVGMIGHGGPLGKRGMDRNILARGSLILTRMLEDDHADVRKHALQVVQRYMLPSILTEGLSLSVLPSLVRVYNMLGAEFADCESLFTCLLEQLGKPCVDGSFESDMLMQAVGSAVGRKPEIVVGSGEDVDMSQHNINTDPRKDPSRLFRLEDEVEDGEPVLRLQLLVYCFRDVILSRKGNLPDLTFLTEMFQLLVLDLKKNLREKTKETVSPIICVSSFTPQGFLSCLKTMLRLLLGMCCVCAANLSETMGDYLLDRANELRTVGEMGRRVIHPVLYDVLDGLCMILTQGCSETGIRSTPGILFLLRS